MDIDIWEDTKQILSEVKVKNRIIRFILQVERMVVFERGEL